MWFDDGTYIVPRHVTAVRPWGKNGSRGARVFLTGGTVVHTSSPVTQVTSELSSKIQPQTTFNIRNSR